MLKLYISLTHGWWYFTASLGVGAGEEPRINFSPTPRVNRRLGNFPSSHRSQVREASRMAGHDRGRIGYLKPNTAKAFDIRELPSKQTRALLPPDRLAVSPQERRPTDVRSVGVANRFLSTRIVL